MFDSRMANCVDSRCRVYKRKSLLLQMPLYRCHYTVPCKHHIIEMDREHLVLYRRSVPAPTRSRASTHVTSMTSLCCVTPTIRTTPIYERCSRQVGRDFTGQREVGRPTHRLPDPFNRGRHFISRRRRAGVVSDSRRLPGDEIDDCLQELRPSILILTNDRLLEETRRRTADAQTDSCRQLLRYNEPYNSIISSSSSRRDTTVIVMSHQWTAAMMTCYLRFYKVLYSLV